MLSLVTKRGTESRLSGTSSPKVISLFEQEETIKAHFLEIRLLWNLAFKYVQGLRNNLKMAEKGLKR